MSQVSSSRARPRARLLRERCVVALALAIAVAPGTADAATQAFGPDCDRDTGALTLEMVRGEAPADLAGRELAAFRNDDAVCRAAWVPAVEDGFVPQGLALLSGTEAILSGYLVDPATGDDRRRCAIVTLDVLSGAAGRLVDLGARSSARACEHAGGIAIAPTGEVVIADQAALFVFESAGALLDGGEARRIALVGDGFVGSFLAPDDEKPSCGSGRSTTRSSVVRPCIRSCWTRSWIPRR